MDKKQTKQPNSNSINYISEEKDSLNNAVIFLDALSKTLEGLRDIFSNLFFEGESKNEKPDAIVNNWVQQTQNIIKEKFEEVYEIKYNEEKFREVMLVWLAKYKEDHDFMLNMKVLFKILHHTKNTIKSKLIASDSLSYLSLTDLLVNKCKSSK
jgi:hypothetical protein